MLKSELFTQDIGVTWENYTMNENAKLVHKIEEMIGINETLLEISKLYLKNEAQNKPELEFELEKLRLLLIKQKEVMNIIKTSNPIRI